MTEHVDGDARHKEETTQGGTTNPHASCLLLTSHPLSVEGHKIRPQNYQKNSLHIGGEEGSDAHRCRSSIVAQEIVNGGSKEGLNHVLKV